MERFSPVCHPGAREIQSRSGLLNVCKHPSLVCIRPALHGRSFEDTRDARVFSPTELEVDPAADDAGNGLAILHCGIELRLLHGLDRRAIEHTAR